MSARRLLVAAVLAHGLACLATAQEGIRWQPTVEGARRLAEQTNRLVLIHFWGDGCPPCMMMERDVFPRADVAQAVEANFVAVKINRSHFPATASQFGITAVPADVVVTTQGQVLQKQVGALPAEQYAGMLTQVAMQWRATASQYAAMPPAPPAAAAVTPGRAMPRYDAPAMQASAQAPGMAGATAMDMAQSAPIGPRYAAEAPAGPAAAYPGGSAAGEASVYSPPAGGSAYGGGSLPPSGYAAQPPAAPAYGYQAPAGQDMYGTGSPVAGSYGAGPAGAMAGMAGGSGTAAPGVQIAAGNPPLALDGFCPVQLKDREQWVPGDPRFGLRHEGRTYLFASADEQRRFFDNPELYAPVMSGNDAVLALEEGQSVPGRREFGAWYKGRVYLFSSEDCYQRFASNPDRYAGANQQASAAVGVEGGLSSQASTFGARY